jgi:Tfp pilus assembly protein PilV
VSRRGLTIIEVLVALVILMIVIAAVAGVFTSSFHANSKALYSTQASQVLSGLAAQVTQHQIFVSGGADPDIIVYEPGPSPQPVAVSPAPTDCATFVQADHKHFCATVTNAGGFNPQVSGGAYLLLNPMSHYNIKVCWTMGGGNSCADADTIH